MQLQQATLVLSFYFFSFNIFSLISYLSLIVVHHLSLFFFLPSLFFTLSHARLVDDRKRYLGY